MLGEQGGPTVVSAIFNPQGTEVATVEEGGRAIIWSTQLAAPLSDVEQIAGARITVRLSAGQKQVYLSGSAG